jgi:hypothetical protein
MFKDHLILEIVRLETVRIFYCKGSKGIFNRNSFQKKALKEDK